MRFPFLPLPLGALLARAGACLLVTGACTTLRSIGRDELRGPNPPSSVRVTQADHSTVVLHAPKVVGDTLEGTVNGVRQQVPLSQTTAIQAREAAPDRTAALVFGAGAVAAFGYVMIGINNPPPPQLHMCCGSFESSCVPPYVVDCP